MLYNKFNVGDEVFVTPNKAKGVIIGLEYDIDIQVFIYKVVYSRGAIKLRETDLIGLFNNVPSNWNSVNPSRDIEKVVYNAPATIIMWKDGTKTIVKCCEYDVYDKEKGLLMGIFKKMCSNDKEFRKFFKKYLQNNEDSNV